MSGFTPHPSHTMSAWAPASPHRTARRCTATGCGGLEERTRACHSREPKLERPCGQPAPRGFLVQPTQVTALGLGGAPGYVPPGEYAHTIVTGWDGKPWVMLFEGSKAGSVAHGAADAELDRDPTREAA